ncbi:MAG TPA: hypothetical protein VGJ44_22550 [Kribbellaceae bacterium]
MACTVRVTVSPGPNGGGDALPPAWVAAGRFPSEIVVREDGGWRVGAVVAVSAAGGEPVFVGRRQEHLYARVRARLAVHGTGGMSVRIDPRHAMDLEYGDGTVRAVAAIGGIRHVLGERPASGDLDLELRLLPAEGSGSPPLAARTASWPAWLTTPSSSSSASWTGATSRPRSPAA